MFEGTPQTKIEVAIESICFIGAAFAVEAGAIMTTAAPGEPSERGRYRVLHVLRDGTWPVGLVRDVPVQPMRREHFQPLTWLVGDWIDESREGTVKTSCR